MAKKMAFSDPNRVAVGGEGTGRKKGSGQNQDAVEIFFPNGVQPQKRQTKIFAVTNTGATFPKKTIHIWRDHREGKEVPPAHHFF